MIDLHSHILPGLDDGAIDLAESLRMALIASDDGIQIIVATPHSFNGFFQNSPDIITSMTLMFNQAVRSQSIRLVVLPGMEIRLVPDLLGKLQRNEILGLNNGRYLLVEMPPDHIPPFIQQEFINLFDSRLGVVIAHPEKNLAVQSEPQMLLEMLEQFPPNSCILQISSDSIVGDVGIDCLKTSKRLLASNIACVIASDGHSDAFRSPRLSQAVRVVSSWVGSSRARSMVYDIPRAILSNPSN